MKKNTTNILTGILSIGLLIILIIQLTSVPEGMFLSGMTMGTMLIILIILTCLILSLIFRIFSKTVSFLTIFFITTGLGFGYFNYKLYSPTLTVVVPINYSGKIDLVLADIDNNILKVDSNGIGYINQWTFDKTYLRPIVKDDNGNSLDSLLVGFNLSSFWGVGKYCCIDKKQVFSKNFKIKRIETKSDYRPRNLIKLVDRQLTKTMKPDKYTVIQTKKIKEKVDNE